LAVANVLARGIRAAEQYSTIDRFLPTFCIGQGAGMIEAEFVEFLTAATVLYVLMMVIR
jgi:hypothetical protein